MTRRQQVRTVAAPILALMALGLALLATGAVHGLTVEYGKGAFAPSDVLLFLGLPLLPAVAAAAAWPTRHRGRALATALVYAVLLAGCLLGARALGEHQNRMNLEAGSRDFACGTFVDPRVDAAFAALPRPVPIYGPVSASPHHCVAGISGGEESFARFRTALRGSGWTVVRDEPGRVAVERDGIRATVLLQGDPAASARQPLLRVAVTGGRRRPASLAGGGPSVERSGR